MDELARCPFCGMIPGTEVFVTQKGGGEDHIDFSIRCDCGIHRTVRLKIRNTACFMDVEKAMKEVVDAWNCRYDPEVDDE